MCVILALAGCGSSSDGASHGTGTQRVKVEGPGANTTSTGTSSTGTTSTGGTSSTGAQGSTSPASIHIDTTPKFASPPPGAPVRSGLVQIALRNVSIAPDAIRVKAGTTVKWTNYDPLQYNVTSVSGPQTLRSGNFGKGASFQTVLSRPGVLHYLCTNYPTTMNGTIEIVG